MMMITKSWEGKIASKVKLFRPKSCNWSNCDAFRIENTRIQKKMPDKNTGFGLVKGISNKEKKLKKNTNKTNTCLASLA